MKRLLLLALSGLLTISATDPTKARAYEMEKETQKINDAVVQRLGVEKAEKIKLSKNVEKESKKYVAKFLKYNEDGTIAFDEKMKEFSKEDVYFAKAKDERVQLETYVDFVTSSAKVANSFVSEGYGYFDKEGNFVPKIDEEDEYIQQSFSITQFSYNVFTGWKFVISDSLTTIAGWAGVLVNCVNLLGSLSKLGSTLTPAPSMNLTDGATTIGSIIHKLFDKILSPSTISSMIKTITKCISNKHTEDAIIAALWGGITIAAMFFSSNPYGWIVKIILTVLSLYLPSLIRGIDMALRGYEGHSTKVNIGYWWSTYNII